MILGATDPSFHRTGISVWKEGSIFIRNCKCQPNADKSFQQVWKDAVNQSDEVVKTLLSLSDGDKFDAILSECPPPSGQFSPALYALDTLLFTKYKNITNSVFVVYPNYLGHVHGKRNYTKTESVYLAQSILDRFPKSIKVDKGSGRISHDEAESFIFLCRLLVLYGILTETLVEFKGLYSEKEKLLF